MSNSNLTKRNRYRRNGSDRLEKNESTHELTTNVRPKTETMENVLIAVILLPLIGAFVCLGMTDLARIRLFALGVSMFTFLLSLLLWIEFDNSAPSFQFVSTINWLPLSNINFYLGLDGISLFFVILTTFLIPVCLLASWESVQKDIKEYMIVFLILETLVVAVFCVLDLLLFYIFFEGVLIPMFIIIGVWGARERKIHAAYQFFLYTLLGSVLMLLAILIIYFNTGTTHLEVLLVTDFSEHRQLILWLAFFASFAVKVPMVPVHIWLPEAHVEAPTAGSVILAGILLKLGTYGFLRFSIPMFPYASAYFSPLIFAMSVIAVIYASLTTLRQIDMKKIIAYSSVAHMNFVTIGLFSLNIQGIEGALILMLSHGIVSSALFLCVGVLYDRHHTRLLRYYGGVAHMMPLFAITFLFFTLANMSLPGTSSFVGEFLILVGAFSSNSTVAVLASTGVVLGAAYSIWLFNRVAFGNLNVAYIKHFYDMNRREVLIFAPFIFCTLWMGIYPEPFLAPMHMSVQSILEHVYYSLSI